MLTKRIIPCLDIKNGRTVKGINFLDLRDAGDPVELARFYSENGADELVFLDISATEERRKTLADLVLKVAETINIPFTVGGGISSVEDVEVLLNNGADKVSINSSAVKNPQLINDLASKFGSQCIVVAIDAKLVEGKWKVHLVGGKVPTELDLFEWAKEVEKRGAGEILFTSMDNDGTKNGFANEALAKLSTELNIPIIASGGAGTIQHFTDAFKIGKADAALAASVFHFKEIAISDLKNELQTQGIPVRITNDELRATDYESIATSQKPGIKNKTMKIDFEKYIDGLVPAIIQDNSTDKVLMLGYMNEEAFLKTNESKKVTFFSRSKQRLWTKGEESGNFLELVSIAVDCDNDVLLIKANPAGPVCHKGFDTCWQEENSSSFGFLSELETVIKNRKENAENEDSYVSSLFRKGINKIAQKVGEEAVETVIEAKDNNDELFLDESADLLFHYLILLQAKGFTLKNVEEILLKRHKTD